MVSYKTIILNKEYQSVKPKYRKSKTKWLLPLSHSIWSGTADGYDEVEGTFFLEYLEFRIFRVKWFLLITE